MLLVLYGLHKLIHFFILALFQIGLCIYMYVHIRECVYDRVSDCVLQVLSGVCILGWVCVC